MNDPKGYLFMPHEKTRCGTNRSISIGYPHPENR